ncbi:MAG: peptide MFS transporter [Candidatus Kapabacteria bacterium]|nr:peptide MFS transporter [Ignavibacteriota bacterium]MCW5884942.1 peptide MFS transporter [Candidatus Kapabacteria bacterium]
MFKGQPKGLIPAALANMGERFGFYVMMAILVLFIQAKFGLDGTNAGYIYGAFYALIYILNLVGGFIADKTRNYKGTILVGLSIMTIGYFLLSIPTVASNTNLILACGALFVIAFGNGLFKGNLQALVGQMYDNNTYKEKRDEGFSIFYMFINVGAIFAPLFAIGVRNWWLERNGFQYNADLPALCHSFTNNTITGDAMAKLQELANQASGSVVTDIAAFVPNYLSVFSTGFHYAFATAIGALVISIIIFLVNKKNFPDPKAKGAAASSDNIAMDAAEVKQRLYALLAVFAVVIFFWFSFHQNGLTLTLFARDYTDLSSLKLNLGFMNIQGAELFQSINPFFVVFLTPVLLAFFGWLRSKGKEPSTPKKIAIGMFIAALAFVVMAIGSLDLPAFAEINPNVGGTPLDQAAKVTPLLLILTYFILTVAELFISPLGLSFVSKVAPPQYQGLMQGGWLGATALGNQLLFLGAVFYESIPISATWTIFVVACLISMLTMLVMLRWLERIAK